MNEAWKAPKLIALEHNTERGALLPMDEYISLAIELSENSEGFPFTRFTPSAAKGLDAAAKEFPDYSPSLQSLIERFSVHGMKVVLTKHEGSGNVLIVPGDSTDIVMDGIPPRQFEVTKDMDPQLKKLVQGNMELLRKGHKDAVIESLRKTRPDGLIALGQYLDTWEEEVDTDKDALALNVDLAEIYRDGGWYESAEEAFDTTADHAWQQCDDSLAKRLIEESYEIKVFLELMYANPEFPRGELRLPQSLLTTEPGDLRKEGVDKKAWTDHAQLLKNHWDELTEKLAAVPENDTKERTFLENGRKNVELEMKDLLAAVIRGRGKVATGANAG